MMQTNPDVGTTYQLMLLRQLHMFCRYRDLVEHHQHHSHADHFLCWAQRLIRSQIEDR
jgi:hypothetical protein